MKNQIIDDEEYAVNLNGERYGVRIPGTKCPVSAESLRHSHFRKRMPLWEIHVWIQQEFNILFEREELLGWFRLTEIKTWSHEKDVVRVNSLRNTKCPVSPVVLWDLYYRDMESTSSLATKFNTAAQVVNAWMRKSSIPRRKTGDGVKIALQKTPELKKRLSEKCKEQWTNGSLPKLTFEHQSHASKFGNSSLKRKRACFVELKCANCEAAFLRRVVPSKQFDLNFCSVYCVCAHNNNFKKSKSILSGIICPCCYSHSCQKCSASKGFVNFRCIECSKIFRRPIIELGLRQDLEAAGALDDGRILASAFVREGSAK